MMKISVIVPIYNVAPYLARCIDSIINQDFEDMEILLINDGSTDESESICKKYMDKDKRVKYFYKDNGGVSSARNFGIEHSYGQYLYFVDPDDYLEPGVCKLLYGKALEYKADLVIGGYRTIDVKNDKNKEFYPFRMGGEVYQLNTYKKREEFVDILIKDKAFRDVIWNKFFKRSMFDNMVFPYRRYEDTFMCFEIYHTPKKIVFVKEIIYNYIINRKGSLTSTGTDNIERWDSSFKMAYDFYSEYPHLNSVNIFYYRCLKSLIRNISKETKQQELVRPLKLMIKKLPLRKIGFIRKLKIIIRDRY